jgi:hypothetical protein
MLHGTTVERIIIKLVLVSRFLSLAAIHLFVMFIYSLLGESRIFYVAVFTVGIVVSIYSLLGES